LCLDQGKRAYAEPRINMAPFLAESILEIWGKALCIKIETDMEKL
jgi:hypothetical protein